MKSLAVCLLLIVEAVLIAGQDSNSCYNQDEVTKAVGQCENATRSNVINWFLGNQWPFGNEGKPDFGNKWPFGNEGKPDFGNKWPFGSEGKPDFGNKWPFGNEGKPDFGNKWPFGSEGKPDFGNKWPFGSEGKPDFGNKWPFGNEGKPDFGNKWPFGNEGMPDFSFPFGRPGGRTRRSAEEGIIMINGVIFTPSSLRQLMCKMQVHSGIQNNTEPLNFAEIKENLGKFANTNKLSDLQSAVDTCSQSYTLPNGVTTGVWTKNQEYQRCFDRQVVSICGGSAVDFPWTGNGNVGSTNPNGGNGNGGSSDVVSTIANSGGDNP